MVARKSLAAAGVVLIANNMKGDERKPTKKTQDKRDKMNNILLYFCGLDYAAYALPIASDMSLASYCDLAWSKYI